MLRLKNIRKVGFSFVFIICTFDQYLESRETFSGDVQAFYSYCVTQLDAIVVVNCLVIPDIVYIFQTDASNTGWGIHSTTHSSLFITLCCLYVFTNFCKTMSKVHIRFELDNLTAVTYVIFVYKF